MKIASIASLFYTPGEVQYFQFLRGSVGADNHQGPYFHQFPDGDVLMYWSAYDFDECSNNSVSLYSISKDRGITWSDPQVFMADYLGGVPCFVLMLRLRQSRGTMMLFARCRNDEIAVDEERRVMTKCCDYFKSSTRIFLRWSNDGGRSFDHGREIAYTDICGGKVLPGVGFYGSADHLMELRSGRILAAFMFMDPTRSDAEKRIQHYTGVCLLSDDAGRTWKRGGEISVDTPRGVMELQMVETEPDRLFCLFRTQGGYLYQTISEDGGETWGRSEPSLLPSPESMARMIRLQSGNLLVVWNNVSSTTQQPRHPLAAAISKDGGRTWSRPKVIVDETGSNQLSNHGLIQLDDGRILLGISHYRDVRPMSSDLDLAIFDELALTEGHRLPPTWRFRTDPKNEGENARWFDAEPDAGWKDIQIDRDWTSQGHDYHGTAWYSVEFTGPKLSAGARTVLRFGAVDGVCRVWLDGKSVGSQLEPPSIMWDKPFFLDLGDAVKPGKKHRLVVKVVKEILGAGIWKPVEIAEIPTAR
jgi:hypothetical protein